MSGSVDRQRRARAIFESVCKLPPAARSAELAKACADDSELRREVLGLLDAEERTGSFLEHGASGVMTADSRRGDRIGRYEITGWLASGGMGEVYQARDTTLGRDVALKLLPDAFLADAGRVARFRREAEILASLNHPHIATIYGLEDVDGVGALALELIAGPTLDDRLADGPLPLEQSLHVARQLVDALDAAHQSGIVHRDLKPANIKLRADGIVKVLDFGLAKVIELPLAPSDQTRSEPAGATRVGAVLGTAAYMSPEQAEGRKVDKRTDIWAFGCVLFEMLTGRRPFSATHVVATSDDSRSAPNWDALTPEAPPALRRLLRRCLEPDRTRRLADIADARFDLAEAATVDDGVAETPRATRAAAGTVEPSPPRGARLGRGAAGLLIVAVGLVGVAGWLAGRRPGASPEAPIRLTLPLPDGYRISARVQPAVAISPDGRRQVVVAYGPDGVDVLVARDLAQLEARVLAGTSGAHTPVVSPDGDWVGFFADGELRRTRFAGSPVERLAAAPEARGASWSADGAIFLAPRSEGGLFRLSPESGGKLMPITQLDTRRGERTHRWPHALPGGRHVLFTCDTVDSPQTYDDARLEAVDVASGQRKVLIEGASRGVYASSGHLLFARSGSLFAVSFDAARLEVTGEPQLILQGMSSNVATGAAQVAVSGTGDLLYIPGKADLRLRRPVWAKGKDAVEPTSIPSDRYFHLALAPGGRRVALTRIGERRNDVWIGDLEGGILNRLTFQGGMGPVWTPDGRRIAYQRSSTATYTPQDSNEVLWKAADGSDEERVLWKSDAPIMTNAFSPDGKRLIVSRYETPTAASSPTEAGREPPAGAPLSRDAVAGAADLWVVPLDGGQPRLLFGAPGFQYAAEFSPDGRWLAYLSDESGRYEVYVRRFPGPGGRWQVSATGGAEPHWSRDGRAIYYRHRHELLRVPVELREESLAAGPAVTVASDQIVGSNPQHFGITADGRILFLQIADGSDAGLPVLVRGFSREVERLRR